jgi:hypothetical protein
MLRGSLRVAVSILHSRDSASGIDRAGCAGRVFTRLVLPALRKTHGIGAMEQQVHLFLSRLHRRQLRIVPLLKA